ETGTGKEVVARLLHRASNRRDKRFVKVNCPALPLTLLESELFGYEKGAFTGADQLKPGKFELASDGVIFLDEIGDMPVVLQAKLLEVLQSGRFSRLGGTRDVQVHSWVIAATNHDLEKDMKDGFFRVDLYYRLNIIKIEIPPLRDRKEDIPLLTEYFVEKHRRNLEMKEPFRLDGDLKKLFDSYAWPGNVRELSNTIAMLMVGYNQEEVRSELLGNMATDDMPRTVEVISRSSDGPELQDRETKEPDPPKSLKDLKAEATKYVEKEAIMHALNLTGWNKREAAKMLNISYKALFYKMANVGIRNNKYRRPLVKRP
ncbi:MAG: sigma-54 dependent transcriptional regulator, partial [Thermodesulfobacteriota bacterium]|nr:sigma-54 dependent transcriptional regulator [Thermodesulfobacteriota bacterium]